MQNDPLYPETSNPDQKVINYRPERPGQDFQRTEASVAGSLPVSEPVSFVPPVVATPVVTASTAIPAQEAGKKPFTLGRAIIVFFAIMAGIIGGYVAYATWLA